MCRRLYINWGGSYRKASVLAHSSKKQKNTKTPIQNVQIRKCADRSAWPNVSKSIVFRLVLISCPFWYISFQFTIVMFALVAIAAAKPQWLTYGAYNSPLVASPALASGAVVSREFHGNTSPYVAALPYSAYSAYAPAAYTAPLVY